MPTGKEVVALAVPRSPIQVSIQKWTLNNRRVSETPGDSLNQKRSGRAFSKVRWTANSQLAGVLSHRGQKNSLVAKRPLAVSGYPDPPPLQLRLGDSGRQGTRKSGTFRLNRNTEGPKQFRNHRFRGRKLDRNSTSSREPGVRVRVEKERYVPKSRNSTSPHSLVQGYLSESFKRIIMTTLRPLKRFVTENNAQGKAVFSKQIDEDLAMNELKQLPLQGSSLPAKMGLGYATNEFPAKLAGAKDVKTYEGYLKKGPGISIDNGTVFRFLDFPPGSISEMHRTKSLDYGVVIEGSVVAGLDSGETRVLHRGDSCVQRATNHDWKNASDTEWARVMFVLLDTEPDWDSSEGNFRNE